MATDPKSGWPIYNLTDVFEIRSGLSKPAADFGSGFPFVTFKDVLDHYFLPETLGSLVQSSEKERELCNVRKGDVFLTRTSETQEDLGMSSVALRDYPEATFNGFTKRLRPTRTLPIIPEYAAYFLRSPRFRAAMNGFSSLSTRASLNNDMIARLQIILPEMAIQEDIGYTLRSLDNKIEQNRQTGRKLEELARAVFKAWFVDFEPVKAKAAGATHFPGMPHETFATLPTRFIDSALGLVPAGWEVGSMGDIGTQRREQIAPEDTNGETPYIGLEHMPRRDIALTDWGTAKSVTSSKFRFRRGDILFGKLRPYFHKVGPAPIDGVCSTDIVVIYPKNPEYAEWLLMLVSSDEFVAHTDRSSAGTKMPRTNWKDMATFGAAVPPQPLAGC
jgi:type I restriction enzyme, S subunit